ncbi:hypothetical protein FACS1894166_06490 [Bacilli bacterium]|nr:hypothetical protein FACS1894166_06490 [Bacilli bacterium]
MMEDRIIENQIKLLPNSGNNFNYKYLAEGTHQLDTATCEITLGVEDPNPTYVPATPHLYLPACISSSDINISPIGMPTKVLSEMSKIIHMDGDEARANQLARKFASYFYTDKNPNGNN